ncbi:acyl-CoA dehydrogenase family protein [Sphingomonas sp. SRS2]|uniref:acyl-CoA dehydrogenase family protein n=1 Tax=Sphingomonas sp. SRS2 TaxID=133190 RepID=UPI0006184D74|nr:acyl-CoA dehydrogenase family protein [Sphingomonas sp. SRS2]KKC27656.1 hypothetical protein WP12_01955 [Sphingomonas sp. SRS2]
MSAGLAVEMGNANPDDLIASLPFQAALATIRERAPEFETLGKIPADIIALLKKVGVYRAAVLRRHGGDEREPADILRMIEAISTADGSTGWVASFAPQAALYIAALPAHRLNEMYADGPDIVVAGGLYPLHRAERIDGKLKVGGRWSFASGCTGADWLGVGLADGSDGAPMMLLFPADRAEVVENWNVVGLRATASHDLVVRDMIVDEDWSAVRGGPPSCDAALYRFPLVCFAAFNHAVVNLGIARAALDEMREIAVGKQSVTGASRPADRPYVQLAMARAETQLRAARALFYDNVDIIWEEIRAGREPTIEMRSFARLAAGYAASQSAEVVRQMYTLGGTTATRLSNSLQRHVRDSMMVTQHAVLNDAIFENAGRILLGFEPPKAYP